jgi:hypothetical protein
MPFYQNITAVAVNPPVSYPPRVWPGRNVPAACRPRIGVAVPGMIARNPYIVWTWRRWPCFDYSHRGPDRDNHFAE